MFIVLCCDVMCCDGVVPGLRAVLLLLSKAVLAAKGWGVDRAAPSHVNQLTSHFPHQWHVSDTPTHVNHRSLTLITDRCGGWRGWG